MTGWIVLAVYVTGWALCSRKATLYFADEFDDKQGTADFLMDRVLGALIGIVWPFAIPVLLLTWRLPKSPKQAKAERDQMRDRIAELEQELNIR